MISTRRYISLTFAILIYGVFNIGPLRGSLNTDPVPLVDIGVSLVVGHVRIDFVLGMRFRLVKLRLANFDCQSTIATHIHRPSISSYFQVVIKTMKLYS